MGSSDEPIVLTEAFKAELRSTYNNLDEELRGECGLTKSKYIEKKISFFESGQLAFLETPEQFYGYLTLADETKELFVNEFYEFACPNSPKRAKPESLKQAKPESPKREKTTHDHLADPLRLELMEMKLDELNEMVKCLGSQKEFKQKIRCINWILKKQNERRRLIERLFKSESEL